MFVGESARYSLPRNTNKGGEYALRGEYKKAQIEQFKLLEIKSPMYVKENPVGLKHSLKLMGIGNGNVRLPLILASTSLGRKIQTLAKQMAN